MSPDDLRFISVSIDQPPREVYDFAAKPENLPRWARGLAGSIEHVAGDEWIARSGLGTVRVRVTPPNELGVLDHDVTLETGVTVHNALRVLPREDGRSEVVFALFRRAGIADADFEADAAAVEQDLRALKAALE
jgi:hypothetical protein